MSTYHFGEDLLDTYQSLSDTLQTLWLVVPLLFVLALFALWLRYRLAVREVQERNMAPPPPSYDYLAAELDAAFADHFARENPPLITSRKEPIDPSTSSG